MDHEKRLIEAARVILSSKLTGKTPKLPYPSKTVRAKISQGE